MADMEIVEVALKDFRRMTREDARAFRRDQKAKNAAPAEEPESADAPAAPEASVLVTSETAAMGKPAGKARGK